jgi:hypothetical protein
MTEEKRNLTATELAASKVANKTYEDLMDSYCSLYAAEASEGLFAKLFCTKPKFSWFERTFCKALVARLTELEDKVQKFTSKPVTWNQYTNLKEGTRAKRKSLPRKRKK